MEMYIELDVLCHLKDKLNKFPEWNIERVDGHEEIKNRSKQFYFRFSH